MIKGTHWSKVILENFGDSYGKMMDFNFIFAHMHCADITVDGRVQADVRAAAFNLIDDKHLKLFKRRIENDFFRYCDQTASQPVAKQLPNAEEQCCHHFVNDAERVVECVKSVEAHCGGVNIIVLLPYVKQLQAAFKVLGEMFTCCGKKIAGLQMYVQDLLSHCLMCADKIEAANRTLQVMNLFLDSGALYECDLCKEVSTDSRFLTPKECCQYALCNACCVQLWKTANTHAKCPACSTSFKS
ncbi:IE-0 [Dione juno nucleopolyhedrovirus]|uniref:IE-0 n=1 Tax=Dione juno nucleopolyhedrovirus TaxID=2594175 RepID=A0AAE6H388_9ABAC|nr:IE-0 [Dione juno nucleopolyhedrovirus]QDL57015.1 IE-0 [Dione juno nucleopolyhedrovirus]